MYLICDLNQLHNALDCLVLVEKEDTFLDCVINIYIYIYIQKLQ